MWISIMPGQKITECSAAGGSACPLDMAVLIGECAMTTS